MSIVERRRVRPDLDAAFGALSDSSRREMIRMLLREPRRAGELAQSEELWRAQLHAFKSYAENPQRARKPKI